MGAPDRRFAILGSAVDGLQLAYVSDLLISGGGTMNREAALLGIPVYSIFAGRQGSLDAAMETSGLIKFVRNEKDVAEITLDRRTRDAAGSTLTDRVERSVIGQIDAFLRSDR
jgi:predicted glycosyltransferase